MARVKVIMVRERGGAFSLGTRGSGRRKMERTITKMAKRGYRLQDTVKKGFSGYAYDLVFVKDE